MFYVPAVDQLLVYDTESGRLISENMLFQFRMTTLDDSPPPVTTKRLKAKRQRNATQPHRLPDGKVMMDASVGILSTIRDGDITAVENEISNPTDGIQCDLVVDRHRSNAMHWAAGGGHLKICELLFNEFGDKYLVAVNKDGRNALHWAARNGHIPVMEWLLSKGFNIDTPTKSGNTALHWAIWGAQLEACKWLVQSGASLHLENETCCTAVHWAAAKGNILICEYLLSIGADFSAINSAGHGVVTKAAWEGHTKLVQYFLDDLKLTSQINLIDVHGMTAAGLARKNGHNEVADLIEQHGRQDAKSGSSDLPAQS